MSRELDVEVAEKVMGWLRESRDDMVLNEDYFNDPRPEGARMYNKVGTADYLLPPEFRGQEVWCREAVGAICIGGNDLPRFSEHMAAAWPIVEKMRERFSLWRTFSQALARAVTPPEYLERGNVVACEVVWRLVKPEHICRAALKVVEKPGESPGLGQR